MDSPCLHCIRVKDPKNCENKACKEWQAWFIDRWESMRSFVRAEMEHTETKDVGLPLGGHHYPHPHLIQEYLANHPCDRCPCQKGCSIPCPVKIAWTKKVTEVRK